MWKNCWADVGEVKRERRVVARISDERAGDLVLVVMGRYIMLEECWTCGFNEKKIDVR